MKPDLQAFVSKWNRDDCFSNFLFKQYIIGMSNTGDLRKKQEEEKRWSQEEAQRKREEFSRKLEKRNADVQKTIFKKADQEARDLAKMINLFSSFNTTYCTVNYYFSRLIH